MSVRRSHLVLGAAAWPAGGAAPRPEAAPAPVDRAVRWRRGIMLVALGYLVVSTGVQGVRFWSERRQLAQVNASLQVTEAANANLMREITYMESPTYIEGAARQQLGMIRSNQVLYRVTVTPGR